MSCRCVEVLKNVCNGPLEMFQAELLVILWDIELYVPDKGD